MSDHSRSLGKLRIVLNHFLRPASSLRENLFNQRFQRFRWLSRGAFSALFILFSRPQRSKTQVCEENPSHLNKSDEGGGRQRLKLPAQPQHASVYYCRQRYRSMRSEHGKSVKWTEILRKCDQEWRRSLSTDQKQPFYDLAAQRTSEYHERLRTLQIPVRPRSPYIIFQTENRSAFIGNGFGSAAGKKQPVGVSMDQISKSISKAWRALCPDERARYFELARMDRLRYYQELERAPPAVRTMLQERCERKQSARRAAKAVASHQYEPLSSYRVTQLREKAGQPRRPPTIFGLFLNDFAQRLKTGQRNSSEDGLNQTSGVLLDGKSVSKQAAGAWHGLSEAGKSDYKLRHKEQMKIYTEKLQKWLLEVKNEGDTGNQQQQQQQRAMIHAQYRHTEWRRKYSKTRWANRRAEIIQNLMKSDEAEKKQLTGIN